nr:hypothetical protein [Mycoplasmopsis bovis]
MLLNLDKLLSRKKSLEKITLDEIKPSNRKYPYINWEVHRAPGKDILEVEDLSYVNEQGETLFENVSFTLARGRKNGTYWRRWYC